jgi:YD repeat-containing protein
MTIRKDKSEKQKIIMKLRLLFHLAAIIFLTHKVFAQNELLSHKNVSIASPTAASLGKFADIPVNYHTGIPNIDIPIYTAQEGPLQLPISLSYHASGLRVSEHSGWVGAGWALNAGGLITRTVKGIADEIVSNGSSTDPIGYLKNKGYYDYLYANNSQNAQPAIDYTGFASGYKDGEPDLYFFNFNGYSGKFYFRANNTPVLVPQQDIKIDPLLCPPGTTGCNSTNEFLYGWIITTPDGVKYYFGIELGNSVDPSAVERTMPVSSLSQDVDPSALKLVSSWYLYKVESPDAKFKINLKYAKEEYSLYTVSLSPVVGNNSSTSGITLYKNFMFGVRLSSISFSNGSINFIPQDIPRQDLSSSNSTTPFMLDRDNTNDSYPAKALKEIQVSSASFCKSFEFSYSYFADNHALQGNYGTTRINVESFYNIHTDKKKLKLDKLKEHSCDNSLSKPSYIFTYYDESTVPRALSFAQDHWGFYNGSTGNNTLLPPVSDDGGLTFSTGADRSASWPTMRAGALKRISYPTGGYSEFNYNSHQVNANNSTSTYTHLHSVTARGSSLPDAKSTVYSINVTSPTTYRISGNKFGGGQGAVYFGSNVWGPVGDDMEQMLIAMPVGVYDFYCITTTSPGGPQLSSYQGITADLSIVNSNTQLLTALVGGLRIDQLTRNDGNKSVVENYSYVNDNNEQQGVLFSRPSYIGIAKNNRLLNSGIATSTDSNGNVLTASLSDGCIPWDIYSKLYYLSASTVFPLTTTQGNHFGYNQVKVTQGDGGYSIYKYKSIQDSQAPVCVNAIDKRVCDPNGMNFPPAPEQIDFSRGEPREISIYNSSKVLLKRNLLELEYTDEAVGVNGLIVMPVGAGPGYLATEYELKTSKKTKATDLELIYNPSLSSQAARITENYFNSPNHTLLAHTTVSDVTSGSQIASAVKGKVLAETLNKYVGDIIIPSCAAVSNSCDTNLLIAINQTLNTYATTIDGNCDALCKLNAWNTRLASINDNWKTYVACKGNYYSQFNSCFATYSPLANSDLKPLLSMRSRNQIGDIIEKSQWRDGKFLGSSFSVFQDFGDNQLFPSKLSVMSFSAPQPYSAFTPSSNDNTSLTSDSDYKQEETYKYANGNLVEVTGKAGVITSYLWGYNNTLPIVRAVGVSYATLSSAYTTAGSDLTALRNQPSLANAQIFTYTHDPLVGMTSQTDPNSRTTTYVYDPLGRLDHIKDHSQNVVKRFEYKYRAR